MKIKKTTIIVVLIIAIISISSYSLSVDSQIDEVNSINIDVNGKVIDADNILIDGTTYVPLRAIAEMLKKIVTWDGVTKTASIYDKNSDKNPYTEEMLEDLVERTPSNKNVVDFRNSKNPRRNGLLKIEGKFFDMYYPNDEYAKEVAKFLAPHMDRVYVMLMDLYGVQSKVEVHLIDYEDTAGLEEGTIRAEENVTFVWLEPSNDQGGNNLSEFVHEVNHNFFQEVNNGASNTMWINEAHAKLVPSLYIEHNYEGNVDMWSFDEIDNYDAVSSMKSKIDKHNMTLKKADSILKQAKSWGRADGEKETAQHYGLFFWMYVYNTLEIDEFKYYIRNLGSEDVLPKLEELFNKPHDEINAEFINYMKEE